MDCRSFIARYPSGTSSSDATRSKTRPGSILPARTSGRSCGMYARAGAGPPATLTFFQKVRLTGIESSSGTPTRPIAPPGTRDVHRREHRVLKSHALQHGMRAQAPGQLAHVLHRRFAALAHHVRRAELLTERDAVGMTSEEDNPFGSAASAGNDAAQTDRAIANDRRRFAWPDSGRNGSVMTSRHHVAQGEQRRHERGVPAARQLNQCSIGVGDADGLALSAVSTPSEP